MFRKVAGSSPWDRLKRVAMGALAMTATGERLLFLGSCAQGFHRCLEEDPQKSDVLHINISRKKTTRTQQPQTITLSVHALKAIMPTRNYKASLQAAGM